MKKIIYTTMMGFAFLSSVLFMTGCKKDLSPAAILTVDSTKALTAYDSSVIFTNYKTVAVADSVSVVNGTTVTKELTASEILYLKLFRDSLTARGFSVVGISNSPDLVLNVTRVASTTSGMIDSAGYWSNYAAVYDPGIYGEPGIVYQTNFKTAQNINDGVLSFEMLDLKDESSANHISIVWNGLVTGYTLLNDVNAVVAEGGILFSKSPYLKTQ